MYSRATGWGEMTKAEVRMYIWSPIRQACTASGVAPRTSKGTAFAGGVPSSMAVSETSPVTGPPRRLVNISVLALGPRWATVTEMLAS